MNNYLVCYFISLCSGVLFFKKKRKTEEYFWNHHYGSVRYVVIGEIVSRFRAFKLLMLLKIIEKLL